MNGHKIKHVHSYGNAEWGSWMKAILLIVYPIAPRSRARVDSIAPQPLRFRVNFRAFF
jgi:hypothetical protein